MTYEETATQITITNCSSNTTGVIVIPASINEKPVTAIGAAAFDNTPEITSVTIPETVTSIGSGAFYGCYKLTMVNLPKALQTLGSGAFQLCPLDSVTIPGGMYLVGDNTFIGSGLRRVTIENGVGVIGQGAFTYTGLTTVVLPPSITVIRDQAFFTNPSMKWVCFQGNAPTLNSGSVLPRNIGFTVYYKDGAQGFSTPAWNGYYALPGQPPLFTAAIPRLATIGREYRHVCTTTGAPVPNITVSSGVLPAGLNLSESGEISGIPTEEGIFTGVLTAANGMEPDAQLAFTLDTRSYRILSATGLHGSVAGGGNHPLDSTVSVSAVANSGYLFAGWTGDTTGTENPLMVLMDADKTITATYGPDTNDDDEDGLTNHREIVQLGTRPDLPDTDGDEMEDGDDAFPLDPAETLDSDGDGTGDNADTDDDGDGYSDEDEINIHGTNPKRSDSDGDGLSDPQEIQTHLTNPNLTDTDSDGLSDGAEVNTHGTLPKAADTDGDGFLDGYEFYTGKSPLNDQDKPALVAEARTAIEFTFPSALGKTYRIEDSFDLQTWSTVESGINGNGGQIQRFYSTRGMPMRYFRVEKDGP